MRFLRSTGLVTAALLGVALATPMGAAFAQDTPGVIVRPAQPGEEMGPVDASDPPEVVIGGEVVMRIRTGAGGLTPAERATAVRARLGPILTMTDLKPDDVEVVEVRDGGTAAIYVRNRLLITADKNLARANDTTPLLLAVKWADLLRQVLPEVEVEVR